MAWIVKTVQEVVDLPLFLDTTNVEAIEAGLKVHRGEPVINSISCRPERMDALGDPLGVEARFTWRCSGVWRGCPGMRPSEA